MNVYEMKCCLLKGLQQIVHFRVEMPNRQCQYFFSFFLFFHEPWDQRPFVSIACLVMSCHSLRSWARLFSSHSPVLHQLMISSINPLHGLPLLFVPSTIPNISFIFLLSSILYIQYTEDKTSIVASWLVSLAVVLPGCLYVLTLYRMVMPIGTPFLKEKINN